MTILTIDTNMKVENGDDAAGRLTLRRHNLIYGAPASGKSTLAYSVETATYTQNTARRFTSGYGSAHIRPIQPEDIGEANFWLERFQTPFRLEGPWHPVRVHTGERTPPSGLGSATTKTLGLLSAALYERPGAIVYLDRPDAGLNPTQHGAIVDLMVYYGMKRDLAWVIETDAEMLIYRLSSRIALGELDPGECQVLETHGPGPNEKDYRLDVMRFDTDGELSSAPNAGESLVYNELMGRAPALLDDRTLPETMIQSLPAKARQHIADKRDEATDSGADHTDPQTTRDYFQP